MIIFFIKKYLFQMSVHWPKLNQDRAPPNLFCRWYPEPGEESLEEGRGTAQEHGQKHGGHADVSVSTWAPASLVLLKR